LLILVFFIIAVLYELKILLFYSGARRASRVSSSDELPDVTVIVAARNEEKNIDACVESLVALDYPEHLFSIVVVDDLSSDGTPERLASWQERYPALTVMRTEGSVHGLRGKANAIAQAIEQCSSEIIMTTDADCTVPPDWVRNTVRQYDADTGCVCGFTLIRGTRPFAAMQCVDWAYLLTIASAGIGWGKALSAVGNNMSFRRQAYIDVGGYRDVGFSVTEDFILFKAIAYRSRWKVRYPVDPSTLVWSQPCADVRELFRQKKRWGRGGLDIHPVGFAIMSVGFLMNASLLLLPFFGLPLWAWITGLAAKALGDTLLLSYPFSRLGQQRLYRHIPLFELYYLLYVTILPFVAVFGGKVVWKGRKL
jgi:cellulose synthase/poly-beta-1,6-N-acetylglucosamine synthase-like glycosyltransferase